MLLHDLLSFSPPEQKTQDSFSCSLFVVVVVVVNFLSRTQDQIQPNLEKSIRWKGFQFYVRFVKHSSEGLYSMLVFLQILQNIDLKSLWSINFCNADGFDGIYVGLKSTFKIIYNFITFMYMYNNEKKYHKSANMKNL